MNNVAMNRPASISSTCRWSKFQDVKKEASIGNNGSLKDDEFFHSGKEFNPWWNVDLENIYRISSITAHNRMDQISRLKAFSVVISLDGEEWFEVHRHNCVTPSSLVKIELGTEIYARHVRIQMIGYGYLHLREVEIFGELFGDSNIDALSKLLRAKFSPEVLFSTENSERSGSYAFLGHVEVFNDDKYPERVRASIGSGRYEERERRRVGELLLPNDRVLEIGTAIGAVAMTAASIVGAENVATFDANPEIVEDARSNFRHNNLGGIFSYNGVLKNKLNFNPGEMVDFHIAKAFWASRMFVGPDSSDIVNTVSVPTFCLEDEITKIGATVLVCDIEGGEVDLLVGAELEKIRLIIMETHYWAVGEKATDEMISYLIKSGFSLHLGLSSNHVNVLRRH